MFDYKIWDYWADKYEKLWVQKYSLTPTRQMILHELEPLVADAGKFRVLDVGCGTGQLLREMQQRFAGMELELTGIDISAKMIAEAQRKSSGISYWCNGVEGLFDGASLAEGGASKCTEVTSGQRQAGEPSAGYDLIVCTHSFPYYPEKAEVLARFAGLLKPGGHLFLAQASENTLYDHLVMPFVKFTTSKAQYPSVKVLNHMLLKHFATVKNVLIKERFYIPSIYLFVAKTNQIGDG